LTSKGRAVILFIGMSILSVKKYPALVVLLGLILVIPQILSGDSSLDCIVSGSLKINGQDSYPGSHIEAYIDGDLICSATTTHQGQYNITIPKYDSSQPGIKGYQFESDVIQLKVDKNDAEPSFNPSPGPMKKDIEVKTTLNVKLTTWGKIKALFK
jgi:hypothetical protein